MDKFRLLRAINSASSLLKGFRGVGFRAGVLKNSDSRGSLKVAGFGGIGFL